MSIHSEYFTCLPDHYDNIPAMETFAARDGQNLSYRFYDSVCKDKVFILLHGSSGEGEYLDPLAKHLSAKSGQVYVPNIRGHYKSGNTRGDCSYVGQLEDDISDLIHHFSLKQKDIYLVGHSSGGGLAIRFGAGPYGKLMKGCVLLAPAIPTAPTMRQGDAGGWAKVSLWKIIVLSILNGFGITWFNHVDVISFNRPVQYCNGTETLSYSFNLNSSYHPRLPYDKDISSLKGRALTVIGSMDESMDPAYYPQVMQDPTSASIKIIPGIRHLEITQNQNVFNTITDWVNNNGNF